MAFAPGDQLTGKWAGHTVTRIIGDAVWVNGPEGSFLIPKATLAREIT